ncbi:MAG: TIGR00730 family Rossman fold protein [Lautropia sp.]|nr:TIGR00730 family Rossman fold protein [Lautropia sp.]
MTNTPLKTTRHSPKLSGIHPSDRSTAIKAKESWHVLGIIAEFVETTEALADIRPAVSIFGSARIKEGHPWYRETEILARKLSDAGFAILSGGGPGLMEAANKGAHAGESPSVGLNMELPMEQHDNPYQDVSLHFRHFFTRKVAFAKYAAAFVAVPGGWGTMDELMEVLTLIQTRVARRIPVILVGASFWQGLLDWMHNTLVAEGTVSPDDMDLIRVIDDPDDVVNAIFDFYQHRGFYAATDDRTLNLQL